MLRIAGVDLIVPSVEFEVTNLEAWVAANIDQEAVTPWLRRAFPGQRLQQIAVPTGFEPARPVRINTWTTRWGASHFGHGHFLASTNQVAAIRAKALGDRDATHVTMEIGSPGLSVPGNYATGVYVLAITPLGRIDRLATTVGAFENGLYLVTVVDERYYWWFRPYPNEVSSEPVGWSVIFDRCAASLGREIEREKQPEAYLKADPTIANLAGDPVPPILDAACANVGQRLVLHASGRIVTYSYEKAIAQMNANQKAWTIRAGGRRFQEAL